MEREFKGVWITKEIYLRKDLTPTDKLLLAEIECFSKNGVCFATNQHFADFLGISKKHVSKLINKLASLHLISIDLIYKEDSKEIDKRIIMPRLEEQSPILLEEDTPPPIEGHPLPLEKDTPPSESGYPLPLEAEDKEYIKEYIKEPIKNKIKELNNNMVESEFELLWKAYPRKQGKAKALKSYLKARKNNSVSFERVQNGINSYKRYIEIHSVGEEYIKHGSTWFGNECWEEEYNLKRDSIKGQRTGFLGLYLNEMESQADIIDYKGGVQYDERGSFEAIGDYSDLLPEPLSQFR
jgi:Helix-turn-helix domain